MALNKELAKMAQKHGICENWYLQLKNENNIDKMLEMYVKGIDFCLSNNYPSNEFIRDNFKGKMEKHGIHLDEVLDLKSDSKVIVLGKCKGTLEVDCFDVCEVFVKHDSDIIIMAHDNSFVMVDIFDNAKVIIFTYDDAKVVVNRYGGTVTQSKNENSVIKVIDKNQNTY